MQLPGVSVEPGCGHEVRVRFTVELVVEAKVRVELGCGHEARIRVRVVIEARASNRFQVI